MKLKTHKALAKRIWITKTGKIMKRYCGQAHFNARNPGNITRKKRHDVSMDDNHKAAIQTLLPYSPLK